MESNCAFCNRKNFEERLIAETNKFYVVATLGQITDGGYVLIIPKGHVPCITELHDTKLGPLLVLVDEVRQAVRKEYGTGTIMFEHGKVGQSIKHAHLHILPGDIADKVTKTVRETFIAEMDCFPPNRFDMFQDMYESQKEPYLFWMGEDNISYVCWNPPAPMQYLRTVVAKLLGRPERANWRAMDPELDKKLWSSTVQRLKPHFISKP